MTDTQQTPVPSPAPINQVQKTPVTVPPTPEQKKAKRKEMFKRLGFLAAGAYLGLIVLIYLWGFLAGGKNFTFFKYIGGMKQKNFDGFLMNVLHVQFGLLVTAALITSLVFLFKSLMTNNQELEKKKQISKRALMSGAVFLAFAAIWLLSIILLGPKLQAEASGGIVTDPANTIGLTAPVEITFDASKLPIDETSFAILSYTWNFGDGSTSNGNITTHRYTKKGSIDGKYTVKLTVSLVDLATKQEFTQSFTHEVVITNEATSAAFTMKPDSGEIPLRVKFDASTSYDPDGEIISYDWDLNGDGTYGDATGITAEYTYENEGNFKVSLKVTDNNGATDIATEQIEAGTVNGLRAIINSDVGIDEIYYTGEKYTFSGEGSQIKDGSITSYIWDFGDGSTKSTGKTVNHTFTKTGKLTIKLTILDKSSNSDSQTIDISVVDKGTPPDAKITSDPEAVNGTITGPVPFEIDFSASTSTDKEKDIISYQWDFNDDGEVDDTGSSASYTYDAEGDYIARLILTDSAKNTSETTVPITVTAQGIVAKWTVSPTSGEVPLTVSFDASASTYKDGTIADYKIDFGEGGQPFNGGSSAQYEYTTTGDFTATLTVVGADGKTATTSIPIVVRPVSLTACFTVDADSGTAPLYVLPDPSCSRGSIKEYAWDYGDGSIDKGKPQVAHLYQTPGTYVLLLKVTGDNKVISTITKVITVTKASNP